MGKFVIYETEFGYNFHLRAANGEAIGHSENYPKKEACMDEIERVMYEVEKAEIEDRTVRSAHAEKYGAKAVSRFEISKDQKGEYRFRLLGADGKSMLLSQGYTAKASCQNGIRSVKRNAPDAEVEEIEIKRQK